MSKSESQAKRLKALILALRGESSQVEFAKEIGVSDSMLSYWSKSGGIGEKGIKGILGYLNRAIAPRKESHLQQYLNGELDLVRLIDPHWNTATEKYAGITFEDLRGLIRDVRLDQAIVLQEDLNKRIANSVLGQANAHLIKSFAAQQEQGVTLRDISQNTGIPPSRIAELARGDSLPCQDELFALSPFMPEPIEELQRIYCTGV